MQCYLDRILIVIVPYFRVLEVFSVCAQYPGDWGLREKDV